MFGKKEIYYDVFFCMKIQKKVAKKKLMDERSRRGECLGLHPLSALAPSLLFCKEVSVRALNYRVPRTGGNV